MNKALIKLDVTNEDINLSPLAFGTLFTNLELILEMSSPNNFYDHGDYNEYVHNIILKEICEYIKTYAHHKYYRYDYNKSLYTSSNEWITLNVVINTIDNTVYLLNKIGYVLSKNGEDTLLEINVNLSKLE